VSTQDKLTRQHPAAAHGCRSAAKAAAGTLKFLTIPDVAELLSLSTRSVRRLIEHGQLPVHRFGGAVRIAEADLRAYIATHRR
jgi:excisionase family DNA binding protein